MVHGSRKWLECLFAGGGGLLARLEWFRGVAGEVVGGFLVARGGVAGGSCCRCGRWRLLDGVGWFKGVAGEFDGGCWTWWGGSGELLEWLMRVVGQGGVISKELL